MVRFFPDVGHGRHHGALFERRTQLFQLLGAAHGKYFDAAVAPISYIAVHFQFSGDMLDVVAKTHSLHTSKDNEPPSQDFLSHSSNSLAKRME